ncbi:MAG: ECF transporter S component [Clostridiales bacterium]|nr:ECF transporter S component [Roseburia sp.]MDD7637903.1 ECF transporter S component [Clostridiales bacterium]MDY4112894.1 ECF transporter S component [Roseburia sp.]
MNTSKTSTATFSTKYLVELALLVAIILLMAFTPIGYIKTAGLEITLIVIPVAVGAVTLGPTAGAILGGVFGITSFIQCFGMSAFGTILLGVNPILTFLVCVPTRILEGWLTGLIYKGLRKTALPSGVSITLANLCCPLLNTTFFMGALVTLFAGTMREQFGMTKVIPFIVMFVGVNGVVEALVCFVIGAAVSGALKKALHYS